MNILKLLTILLILVAFVSAGCPYGHDMPNKKYLYKSDQETLCIELFLFIKFIRVLFLRAAKKPQPQPILYVTPVATTTTTVAPDRKKDLKIPSYNTEL